MNYEKAFIEGSAGYRIAKAIEAICSGSGFDSPWDFKDMGSCVRARTEWHLMDENGFYCGYYPFKVILPKDDPGNFRMYGEGRARRYLERYGVWEYIEETLCFAVSSREVKEEAV
jgi:hypothetical protein